MALQADPRHGGYMLTFTPRLTGAATVVVLSALVSSSAPSSAAALAPAVRPGRADTVAATRAAAVAAAHDSAALVARLLAANGAPVDRAAPAARAIMRYARQRSLDPLLIVGIIGVENAALVPRARSRVGAQGVMQVMPSWKRDIKDCGGDLRDVTVNVCFGTRILRIAMDASTSVREALLRYNGCVRAPGCHRYASAVFSQAGRALVLSRMETAMADPARGGAPAAATALPPALATTVAPP
jgi:soluble lytic murein transglycosylase-like protein